MKKRFRWSSSVAHKKRKILCFLYSCTTTLKLSTECTFGTHIVLEQTNDPKKQVSMYSIFLSKNGTLKIPTLFKKPAAYSYSDLEAYEILEVVVTLKNLWSIKVYIFRRRQLYTQWNIRAGSFVAEDIRNLQVLVVFHSKYSSSKWRKDLSFYLSTIRINTKVYLVGHVSGLRKYKTGFKCFVNNTIWAYIFMYLFKQFSLPCFTQ